MDDNFFFAAIRKLVPGNQSCNHITEDDKIRGKYGSFIIGHTVCNLACKGGKKK